jgi:dienelactone hydrolase
MCETNETVPQWMGRPRASRYVSLVALPAIAFAAAWCLAAGEVPVYDDHQDLLFYLDDGGERREVRDAADWQRRRAHIMHWIEQVTGSLPERNGSAFPVPVITARETTTTFVRHRVIYHTDSSPFPVAAHLLVPKGVTRPLPAVLCLHQTTAIGKDEPAGLGGDPDLHLAHELAERGYVTLAPDYPSFGESEFDFDPAWGYASGIMKAVWDNRRAVDVLVELDEVDAGRIGVIGHSLGGHGALFAAAFDDRLRVVVSSCGFTTFARYRGGNLQPWSQPLYMPRIATRYDNDPDQVPFDFGELIAVLAPRPLLAIAPLHDHNFDVEGARHAIASARSIHTLLDAAANLEAYHPACGHAFPDSVRERAYGFLDRWLNMSE